MIVANSSAIIQEANISNQIQYMFETERLMSLSELAKAYDIPGLSLALISDKKIATFECGVKNSISRDPVTSSTVFEAASLSKPLIAYAALELCEKGLLEMDQPLSTYLPNPESDDPFLSAVTLRHVLTHTGGFPTANLKPGEPLQLEFYPGSQFAYSGESFCYLGRVIERIIGDSLASYMQEHVLTPLKMNNSSFIWKKSYMAQAASPHDQKGRPTEKWKPVKAIASFSLHTTASDYAKFMIMARQFPAMSEIQVQINKEIGWGLGWGIETTPKGSSFWHSGDNGTFQCLAFQNEQTGFVIMTSSANGMKMYRHVFDLLIGSEHPLFDWEQFDSRAEEKLDEESLANWWKIYRL